ncbi:MAG: 30S ribosomal protein S21 [bacterium]|nr:30S ribosomal protein S21 [bacterium]
MHIKKRDNESSSSLLFRFNKRVKQSGLLKEARKRRFAARPVTKRSRLISALHREEKKVEHARKRKMGIK